MLLTGASGFLGGHLVELLVDKGYSVVCMVRKTSNTSILDRLGLKKRVVFGHLGVDMRTDDIVPNTSGLVNY